MIIKSLIIIGLVLFTGFLSASGQIGSPTTTPKPLAFHAPDVASSVLPIRVGGGSRGGATNGLALVALVPDCLVYTSEEQPNLFWYQSGLVEHPCQITITEPKKSKPLVVVKSDGEVPAGVHAARLAKLKIKLVPDVIYYWSVEVLFDPNSHSQDVIASGLIQLKKPTPEFAAQLAAASDVDRPSLYAQNGYWYDALESLTNQIDNDPKNETLRANRVSLLRQVGLDGDKIAHAYASK